ncbi:hypothetical protein [uncultured Sphingomonas sp.]|uniref:hypothetical protein n=1 Tax=uncultured Sphingomonas sp. TaxID=158754 RepID=UPI0025E74558|nr:hypothetical protein [uncultured Sphingomonas sp.]
MTKFTTTARTGAILFGACALLAGSIAPASAATRAFENDKKQELPQAAKATTQKICVEAYETTGSRIPHRRECKTRAEWIRTTGIDPLTDNLVER